MLIHGCFKLCLLYINYVFQFGLKMCLISLLHVCLLFLQLSKAHKESVSFLFSSLFSTLVTSLLLSLTSLLQSLLYSSLFSSLVSLFSSHRNKLWGKGKWTWWSWCSTTTRVREFNNKQQLQIKVSVIMQQECRL